MCKCKMTTSLFLRCDCWKKRMITPANCKDYFLDFHLLVTQRTLSSRTHAFHPPVRKCAVNKTIKRPGDVKLSPRGMRIKSIIVELCTLQRLTLQGTPAAVTQQWEAQCEQLIIGQFFYYNNFQNLFQPLKAFFLQLCFFFNLILSTEESHYENNIQDTLLKEHSS